jgi:hypothetical protein
MSSSAGRGKPGRRGLKDWPRRRKNGRILGICRFGLVGRMVVFVYMYVRKEGDGWCLH